MTEETSAPSGEQTGVVEIKTGSTEPLSILSAARETRKAREKTYTPAEPQPKEAAPPVTESEPPQAETDAAPPEEAPGETTQESDPAELPPIEPPRSWTKDEKERFATLPRETQEYLANKEHERERTFRQSQNEAAERRKAAEAAQQKAEQARQQFEAAVPQLYANMRQQFMGEFGDVKSFADVEKMAAEDPFRYARFQVAQQKLQTVQREHQIVQQRQAQELQHRFEQFANAEDAKFAEAAPEMADAAKAKALRENAVKLLRNVGFKDAELAAAWKGQTGVSIRDHRIQTLILKASLYDDAQAKAKAVASNKAPVPPVQRPGTARPAGAAQAEKVQALNKQLETASGAKALRVAADLLAAKRAASR